MPATVTLRPVADADLPVFYAQQLDPDAIYMAAFTHKDPADRAAFDAHWAKIRNDASVMQRTIEADGAVAGWVGSYGPPDEPEVTYWLGRDFWGQGLATEALRQYLRIEARRPIYGRVAADNVASLRVLEKCGFRRVARERGFANARGEAIEELLLRLDVPA